MSRTSDLKIIMILLVLLLSVATLWSCDDDDDDDDDDGGGSVAAGPPVVYFVTPSSEPSFTTSSATITLGGVATDEGEITELEYGNEANEETGDIEIEEEWSFSLTLQEGDNRIVVQAEDNDGNTNTAETIAVYNPYLTFQSFLTFADDAAFINEATAIQASIVIEQNDDLVAGSVKLIRVDNENFEEIEEVATFSDDGDTTLGDDIPNDWNFNTIVNIFESGVGTIYYRAKATVQDATGTHEVFSDIAEVSVLEHLDAAEVAEMQSLADQAQDKADDGDSPSDIAEWLRDQDMIAFAQPAESGNGVWWVYENGILGGMINNAEGTKSRVQPDVEPQVENAPVAEPIRRPFKPYYKSAAFLAATGEKVTAAADEENPNAIGNFDAIYIGPYLYDFGNGDDYHGAWKLITDSECPVFRTKEYKNSSGGDNNTGPSVWKNLSNYGMVVVSSHGDTWYNGLASLWKDKWGDESLDPKYHMNFWQDLLSQPVVLTKATYDATTMEKDLQKHRIAVHPYGPVTVTPAFIKHYNKNFPKSIIYISACRSAYNNALSSAFIANGAQVYLGYSEYVAVSYAHKIGKTFVERLIDYIDTAKEAFDEAVKQHGTNDGSSPPAYARLHGKGEAEIGEQTVTNGSFEEGLKGWDPSGDARAISYLGYLSPRDGNYMAIISTGLGAVSDSASTLSQSFCAPILAESVTFEYDFVSEEPMEYVGSEFDDKFEVTITVNDGSPMQVVYETVNNSSWSELGGDYFGGGDDTTYHTGWRTVTVPLADYFLDKVTITFTVWDVGDSAYDSAALIDNVELNLED